MLGLVKAFLKAGVMTAPVDREETLTGTPQGGILSPLLANIALSVLDEHFTRQWDRRWARRSSGTAPQRHGLANWRLVRYADDFVFLVSGERHHAEALREQVAAVMAPMGLRLSPEKTRVVHIDEGFDFLGFHIRRMRKRGTNKHYVYTTALEEGDRLGQGTGYGPGHTDQPCNGDLDELMHQPEPDAAGMGELLPARRVQSDVQRDRLPRLVAGPAWIRRKHRPDRPQQLRRRFCRPGLADRPQRGRVHRRLQRRRDPLPLPRQRTSRPPGPRPANSG